MRGCVRFAVAVIAAGFAIPFPWGHAAEPPPDLAALQSLEPKAGPEVPFAEEKRADAVRLAALGFGSRAGLTRRTWEIAALLERHAGRLSAIYRFGDLMLSEAGFSVLPPVVAETRDAFRLERVGTRAASAERVFRIVAPARLLSAAPHWRDWLGRSWPDAAPPASVLFPRDAGERTRWRTLLAEGFAQRAAPGPLPAVVAAPGYEDAPLSGRHGPGEGVVGPLRAAGAQVPAARGEACREIPHPREHGVRRPAGADAGIDRDRRCGRRDRTVAVGLQPCPRPGRGPREDVSVTRGYNCVLHPDARRQWLATSWAQNPLTSGMS